MNYMRSIPKAPQFASEENPYVVLLWNTQGFEKLLADPDWVNGCSVPCKVTSDRSTSNSAHMIVSTGHDIPDVFSILEPFQQKALFVLEPDLSLPDVNARMGPFHMLTSYSRHSDVRIDYSRSLVIPTGKPNLEKKKGKALAAAFINNCDTNGDARYRLDYLKELSSHMDIHSYGSCAHTPDLPTDVNFKDVANDYYFVIVFENSILDDYVTDKFYEALGTDAIPIYLGAPNAGDFLPDRFNTRIIIEARHYPDPAGLAKYLKGLSKNEEAYMEYFQWRDNVIDQAFSKNLDFEAKGEQSFACRMCKHYDDRSEK